MHDLALATYVMKLTDKRSRRWYKEGFKMCEFRSATRSFYCTFHVTPEEAEAR